jgi:hypothetical protein
VLDPFGKQVESLLGKLPAVVLISAAEDIDLETDDEPAKAEPAEPTEPGGVQAEPAEAQKEQPLRAPAEAPPEGPAAPEPEQQPAAD